MQIIVEDADGEVVKTFQLPSSKSTQESSAILGSSLKYLGLGALGRQNEKNPQAAAEEGKAGDDEPAPSRSRWTAVRRMTGTAPGEKMESDDDHNIRFTIGGVGRRMNKEDFIKEVQKLDTNTRKEVAEESTASRPIKEVAKRNPNFVPPTSRPSAPPTGRPSVPRIVETRAESSERSQSSQDSSRRGRPAVKETSSSPSPPPASEQDNQRETPVERRRRLAVLGQQQSAARGSDDPAAAGPGETPAERRRREAALGMGGGDGDSDSEDEGGERVPPARRGIRFAEPSRR